MAETSTKAIMVITAIRNVEMKTEYQQYVDAVIPLYKRAGGEMVCRYQLGRELIEHGSPCPTNVLVMQFPSEEAIESMFRSPEYEQIIPLRDRVLQKLTVAIMRDQ